MSPRRPCRRRSRRTPIELLIGSQEQPEGGYAFYAFLQGIAERKQIEHELRERHRVMQSLTGRLISSHEDERRRLAHHLHDDLSQRLAIWSMELSLAQTQPLQSLPERLRSFQDQIDQLADDIREISHRLHPAIIEQLGLVDAIQRECEHFAKRQGLDVRFEHSDLPPCLPAEIALPLYRIGQEALRNIAKHALAKHVQVRSTAKTRSCTFPFRMTASVSWWVKTKSKAILAC
jgi:signal transduction histidine kinase